MSEEIEKVLRFNCPASCDGHGTYAVDDGYGNPEASQCQWCFEFGMPARDSIEATIRDGITFGWRSSGEGYNYEYAGGLSVNPDEIGDEIADSYLTDFKKAAS